MIRSYTFSTQGRLNSQNIEPFLMPTILADTQLFLWVDLQDPSPEEVRMVLQDVFKFHPLSIEDCINESSTPKVEEYLPKDEDLFSPYLFLVIHAVDYSRKDGVFATSELNFFLGRKFLVTFHDKALRSIEQAFEICGRKKSNVARAPDRVAHLLLDALVDNYRPALEELALEISEIEEQVLDGTPKECLNKIIQVKKEVFHLRQIMEPQRQVLSRLARGEFQLIRAKMVPYYRDVYDGLFQIYERAQTYTDSVTGILQVYLNLSSNQTGEVVKLLTMITLITTPMMMVGSWYGMNFNHMPELTSKWGYLIVTILTAASTGTTYWYFKRKKWL